MMMIIRLILLILLFFPAGASAEFYRFRADSGHLIFTDDVSRIPRSRQAVTQTYVEYVSVKEAAPAEAAGQTQPVFQENRLLSVQFGNVSEPETAEPETGGRAIIPSGSRPDASSPPGFKAGGDDSTRNIACAVKAQVLIWSVALLLLIFPLIRNKRLIRRYRGFWFVLWRASCLS